MRRSTLLSCFLLILAACEYNNRLAMLTPGVYRGHFVRTSAFIDYNVANVTLTISNGKFSGESNIPTYPAICRGSYKFIGQEIEFENECAWPANFDWSFILSGKFQIQNNGKNLDLTKVYANGQADYYNLTLQ